MNETNMRYLSPLPPSPPPLTLQSDTRTEQILGGTERWVGVWFGFGKSEYSLSGVLINWAVSGVKGRLIHRK